VIKEIKTSDILLVILDVDNVSNNSNNDVIHWSSYTSSKSDGIFSIPQIVEKNAERLKTKYLELIYEFGKAKVNGKSLIDHLEIRHNFSYWWMTLIVEKCNYSKSPQIDNIIKLLALEQWLQKKKYHKLQFEIANEELAIAVSQLAKQLSIDFEWKKTLICKNSPSLINRIYYSLPNIFKAPIWLLRYLFDNWSLKGVGIQEWKNTTITTTFVSYLFNLAPEEARKGRYESRYWTKLTSLLDDNEQPTNWLHIYVKDELLPSAKKARDVILRFNKGQNSKQTHVTLSSFLSVALALHVLKDWYKVLKSQKLICKQLQLKSDYLWPLFKKDCQDSMSGISAISNLLYYNLFEKAMRELPTQDKGCYLQENQGWEFGFISAWQSVGHGKNLIGFPHSTVRYWDLRYFFDPRSYPRKGKNSLPLPNLVGVNGDVTKNFYLDGGYPHENLIELEALRYLHLSSSANRKTKRDTRVSNVKTVLVVGDYLRENTDKQLSLLLSAHDGIDQSIRFIIKPHPACPINMDTLQELDCEVTMLPITELLAISDVVYSSAVTSAAVDAYCSGLPVITMLDGKTLNLSPLKGFKGVSFVTTVKELTVAINNAKVSESEQGKDYFYLDAELPRWKRQLTNGTDRSKKMRLKGNTIV
jgi:surface carbohydrate biosynthesis protein (TIGR04326 family)